MKRPWSNFSPIIIFAWIARGKSRKYQSAQPVSVLNPRPPDYEAGTPKLVSFNCINDSITHQCSIDETLNIRRIRRQSSVASSQVNRFYAD